MTTDQERFDQIAAREAVATPGPWAAADEHGLIPGAEPAWCVSRMDGDKWLYDVAETVCDDEQANAEFIAATREDVPWLLSVVRDQAEQITALRAEIAATNVHGKFSGAEWLLGFDAITDRRAALAAGGAPTEPATDEWHWGDSARGDWLAYQPHPYRNANRVGTNECWCGLGPYAEHHRRPGPVPQGGTA